ncbi:Ig-like domain-containing protein [Paenibacillus sp. N4]|uniref:Ig-like domain-containing protein n=1 Tax=Paenibacillus vietnamensis TaxID=2590547 RepID=UPI001CD0E3E1|nr:Ig-like domain-containing protein [Paenibacillus vietnamensis]MCA0757524.1 Ig-like domain-containing protein [Paenibacillus vietnamensis]
MREKSDLFLTKENKQNSQQSKQFRGGVTKVMKKKLAAFVLSSSMVLSMTVPAFAAATETDPGKYLQGLEIIKGDQNGDLMEEANWDREDVAVLISRLLGKEAEAKATAKGHTYKDVKGTYYDGFLTWAKAEGLMEGNSATDFGFDDDITYKQFAAVVLRALGIDTTGDNYANVPALAVEAGIVPAGTNFDAVATRGATYGVLVTALNTVIPGTGQTLGNKLGLPGFEVAELALGTVAQSGAKKITVNFNREVTAEEKADLTFEVKNGLVPYVVTSKWAEGNKSVALESSFLPAGEYTVTVKGFDAKTVVVAEEKVSKLEIGATTVQVANNFDLAVKAKNQFDEEVANAGFTVNVYAATQGVIAADENGKYDFAAEGVVKDESVVVTVVHPTTGLSVTKTFKAVEASSAAVIQLSAVAPLKDKVRISTGETGFVLPYTLVDQYGGAVKLPQTSAVGGAATKNVTIGDINFVVNNENIISASTFAVDADGKLTFNTGATAGTAVITAVNSKTGASSSIAVKVEEVAALKTFQISNPGVLVVAGEEIKFPYAAADSFSAPIAAKDVPAAVANLGGNFNITSSNPAVTVARTWNSKGELSLQFTGSGTTTVFVWVNGQIASQITVDVKAAVSTVKVTGKKANLKTTLGIGAKTALGVDQLTLVDNYGRVLTALPTGFSLVVTESATPANAVSYAANEITAGNAAGNEKVSVGIEGPDADATVDAGTSIDIEFAVIADADIKTFTISSIGTLYGAADALAGHQKAVTLVGKTASGTEVAIDQVRYYTSITSSDLSVATIVGGKVVGQAKGTSTITVWNGATKLAETTVTISDVKPVISTVKFTEASVTVTNDADVDAAALLEVKDQYGVDIAKTGTYSSSDNTIATVSQAGLVERVKDGEVTITFVSANGLVATTVVTYE